MCTGNTLSWFLVWRSSLQHCYFSLVGKCDEDVCLCVFPWACFHNYMSRFHQMFVLVTCGRGSVLWWRFDTFLWTMLCLHIMARNRWCIKMYTQTDSPWGSTGPGLSLILAIAELIVVLCSCRNHRWWTFLSATLLLPVKMRSGTFQRKRGSGGARCRRDIVGWSPLRGTFLCVTIWENVCSNSENVKSHVFLAFWKKRT